MATGWTCPNCGVGNAPWVYQCCTAGLYETTTSGGTDDGRRESTNHDEDEGDGYISIEISSEGTLPVREGGTVEIQPRSDEPEQVQSSPGASGAGSASRPIERRKNRFNTSYAGVEEIELTS